MSEKGGNRPDASRLTWGGTQLEFSPAKKAAGWTYAENIPHQNMNWLQGFLGEYTLWTHDAMIRTFDTIQEAIDGGIALGEEFMWHCGIGNPGDLPSQFFGNLTGPVGLTGIRDICTDGAAVYVCTTTQWVYRFPIDADDEIGDIPDWEYDTSNAKGCLPRRLCTDGENVYLMYSQNLGQLEASRAINCVSGSLAGTFPVFEGYGEPQQNASNGSIVVEAYSSGEVRSLNASTYAQLNQYTRGAANACIAIDDKRCYVAGTRDGSFDVTVLLLSTLTLDYRYPLYAATAPSIQGIAVDRDSVYVVGNQVLTPTYPPTSLGGYPVSMWCYPKHGPSPFWNWFGYSGGSNRAVCIDGEFVYTDSVSEFAMFPKRMGSSLTPKTRSQVNQPGTGNYRSLVTNGRSLYCINPTQDRMVVLYPPNVQSRMMYRADPSDASRYPYFHVAQAL